MRRVGIVFAGLIILIIYSVAILMANDIAEANPVIRKILQIKEKTVEVETVKTEIEYVYIEREVELLFYQFWATGYSANDPAQGTTDIMASGKKVYQGAIAADPEVLPIGTVVEIMGLSPERDGYYTVEDVGGAIKGLHIDIFCESKFEALQINQQVWLRILEEK